MSDRFSRTERLLGPEAMRTLSQSRVAVFGIGGVGGYAVEALARSGVGQLDLIDHDTISETNINRQLHATHSTVGRFKAEVAAERVADINPQAVVRVHKMFFISDTADELDFSQYDYVVDAIDTVTGKLELAVKAKTAGVPMISSMGTGNKLDPTAFEVADIADTAFCPLARIMRKELRRRGIEHLKVVYSKEEALDPIDNGEERPPEGRRSIPGSIAFVPSVAGLILAGEVIKDLVGR